MACEIIKTQLQSYIEGNHYMYRGNDTTMKNTMDIVFPNGNYTMGKLLEYQFYKNMFPKILTYVSFFKIHPHSTEGILRVSFKNVDNNGLPSPVEFSFSDLALDVPFEDVDEDISFSTISI